MKTWPTERQRQIELLKELADELARKRAADPSPQAARKRLIDAGILDENGDLTEPYYALKGLFKTKQQTP